MRSARLVVSSSLLALLSILGAACDASLTSDDGLDEVAAKHIFGTSCSNSGAFDCDECCTGIGYDDGRVIRSECGCTYVTQDASVCAAAVDCGLCCGDKGFDSATSVSGDTSSCTCGRWGTTP